MCAKLCYILRIFLAYLALNVGTFLMLRLVAQYATFDDHVGFLAEKQDYLHLKVWKAAFYTHVFSSIFCLLVGFTQFSSTLLKHHRKWHRRFGYLYAWDILVINFPAGLIMAIYANGHLPSKVAFLILDSLWFWFTLMAILEAKRGNIAAHRDFMIRSYALTLSALTLRTWKMVLVNTTSFSLEHIYMLDAWLGFVPNWLLAEILIASRKRRRLSAKIHKGEVCENHSEGENHEKHRGKEHL